MKIGYIRVSTEEQNTVRQEVMMQELGIDEIYIDKASGTLDAILLRMVLFIILRKSTSFIAE